MGYQLSLALFRGIEQGERFPNTLSKTDYRYLIITRNWYEAIVSGYLYHKSGRECWLDQDGNPAKDNYLRAMDPKHWVGQYVQFQNRTLHPPQKGRDICTYLKEESEEAGLRAYMDVAWGRYYEQVVRFYYLTKVHSSDRQRTLRLCFEDLTNETQQKGLIKRAYRHWLLAPPPSQRRDLVYEGGHATNHDPELRKRLRSVIAKVDAAIFDNLYARLDQEFGCGCVV